MNQHDQMLREALQLASDALELREAIAAAEAAKGGAT